MSLSIQQQKFSAYQLIQSGNLHEARALLQKLSKVERNDYEILYQLGAVNGQLGDIDDAEKCFLKCIKIKPDFIEARIALSTVFHIKRNYNSAIKQLKSILQQQQNNIQALYALGNVQKDMGDYQNALINYKRAVELAPQWVEARSNLASTLHYLGHISEAVLQLRKALEVDPSNIDLNRNLAITLVSTGQVEEANNIINKVLEREPDNPQNYFAQGTILSERQLVEQAIESFEAGLKKQPDNIDAQANLAALYEKFHDTDMSKRLCRKALTVNPHHVRATLTLTKLENRENNFEEGIERLKLLLNNDLNLSDKSLIYMQLGKMLDRVGRFEEAFTAFASGNNAAAKIINFKSDADHYLTNIKKIQEWFNTERVKKWNILIDDGGVPAPAFIVGFPRSGTTLLDQVLASHTKINTGDEILFINSLIEELPAILGATAVYPDCLSDLSSQQIAYLRKRYWELFRQHFGNSVNQQVFVDKFPMNILHLGFINRVFPDGKIIVVLRDPRDACLSGFMQTFSNNQAMNYFLTLKSTAQLYDSTMGLWLEYRAVLKLDYIDLYYEDLTEDLEASARKLIDYLGLDWEEGVLDYWKRGKQRYLSTPSYQDITQPVYSRAVGRWKNYREQIKPIMHILQPYIEKFEYVEE